MTTASRGSGTADARLFGLALSGGSLRGLAHLGVLEVLHEHGLRPGWISGTSAGAIAGAFAAFGMSPAATEETLSEVGWKTLSRARPFASIGVVTNEGLGDLITGVLGEVAMEDADIPLAVVATDINTGERVVLDHGPLASAVRASCCIPGLYAPVEIEGRMLVDGSLVENVPAHAVRELGASTVVAVSLGVDLPFNPVHNWVHVMVNAFEIAMNTQMQAELRADTDVVIRPRVSGFSKVHPRDRASLIEAGRVAAEQAMPQILDAVEAQEARSAPGLLSRMLARLTGR